MDDFEVIGHIVVDASGNVHIQNLNKELDSTTTKTSTLANATKGFGDIFRYVWANIILQAVNTVKDALIAFGASILTATEQAQVAQSQLQAVIASTADKIGLTIPQLNQMASGIEKLSGFTHTQVVQGETMMLQFTNIGQKIFPQALQVTADLARRMGVDFVSAANMVGKALGMPEAGIGRLNMAYRLFDQTQLKAIESMAKGGNAARAQQIILDALTAKLGGAAKAFGETFAGKVEIFNALMDDLKESIGNLVLPVLTQFIGEIIDSGIIDKLTAFTSNLTGVTDAFSLMGRELMKGDINGLLGILGGIFLNIGTTIGDFLKRTDWSAVSKDVAAGINSIDWSKVGMDMHGAATAIGDGLDKAVKTADWGAVGKSVVNAFMSFVGAAFLGADWSQIKSTWKSNLSNMAKMTPDEKPKFIDTLFKDPFFQVRIQQGSVIADILNDIKTAGTIMDSLMSQWISIWLNVFSRIRSTVAGAITGIIAAILSWIAGIDSAMRQISKIFYARASGWLEQVSAGLLGGVYGVLNTVHMVLNMIMQAIGKGIMIPVGFDISGISGNISGIISSLIRNLTGGGGAVSPLVGGGSGVRHKQYGGDVFANAMYMVGETGPEPFIPKVDGSVISNANWLSMVDVLKELSTAMSTTIRAGMGIAGGGGTTYNIYGSASFNVGGGSPSNTVASLRGT